MTQAPHSVIQVEQREYRKIATIRASQWWKNGDHPLDNATEMFDYPDSREADANVMQRPHVIREGEIVRYYRHPEIDGNTHCKHCDITMHLHGWIDTLEGGHIVCPGDWIATGVKGEHWPIKPDVFAATYVPAERDLQASAEVGREVSSTIRAAALEDIETIKAALPVDDQGQWDYDVWCAWLKLFPGEPLPIETQPRGTYVEAEILDPSDFPDIDALATPPEKVDAGREEGELLPCPNPWCNSHDRSDLEIFEAHRPVTLFPTPSGGKCAVACPVCPMQSPWKDTVEDAVATWNTRAPDSAVSLDREAASIAAREEMRRQGFSGGWDHDALIDAILALLTRAKAQADPVGEEVKYPRMQIVRGHKHTCANVQIGSTWEDKCDCGALDSAGEAIPVPDKVADVETGQYTYGDMVYGPTLGSKIAKAIRVLATPEARHG